MGHEPSRFGKKQSLLFWPTFLTRMKYIQPGGWCQIEFAAKDPLHNPPGPILQRLGQMRHGDALFPGQIGNRARQLRTERSGHLHNPANPIKNNDQLVQHVPPNNGFTVRLTRDYPDSSYFVRTNAKNDCVEIGCAGDA